MRKIVAFLLAGALAGAGIWLFLVHRAPARHTVVVYEAGRSLASVPLYVAAVRGYFMQQGISVRLHMGEPAPSRLAARVDVLVVPFDGLPPGSVTFAVLTRCPDFFLYGRQADPHFKWEDAREKVIVGLEPDADGQVALEYILRRHKLRPQTHVHLVQNLPGSLRSPAWEAGTGDYILLSPLEGFLWEQKGKAHYLASLREAAPVPGTACAAPRASLAARQDLYARFTAALQMAQEWIKEHTAEEVAAVTGPFFPHLRYATLLQGVRRYRSEGMWAAHPAPGTGPYARLQEMRRQAGETAGAPPFRHSMDPRPAAQAVKLLQEQKKKAP
ncbi:MAG: hypothetical protein AB1776_00175 [Bacillota bacterium]